MNLENFRLLGLDQPIPAQEEYEARIRNMLANIPVESAFIVSSRIVYFSGFILIRINIPVACFFCMNKQHAKKFTQLLLSESGEGIILRKQKSAYIGGYTDFLFKFKVN